MNDAIVTPSDEVDHQSGTFAVVVEHRVELGRCAMTRDDHGRGLLAEILRAADTGRTIEAG